MRSSQEIVDQTNEISRIIYASRGYVVKDGFKFYGDSVNRHPHEESCWDAACQIQLLMTETDAEDALTDLED